MNTVANSQSSAEQWSELIDIMIYCLRDDFDPANETTRKLLQLIQIKRADSQQTVVFSRALKVYIQKLTSAKVHLLTPTAMRPFLQVLAEQGSEVFSKVVVVVVVVVIVVVL
eukprot:524552-Pyramimonas_sp.AAC.1